MSNIGPQTIASSYNRLLILPGGGGDGANLVTLSDGDNATTFALKLSTNAIAINQGQKLYFDGGNDTYISNTSDGVFGFVANGKTLLELSHDGTSEVRTNALRIQDENNEGSADSAIFLQAQAEVNGGNPTHYMVIGGSNYAGDTLLLGRHDDHNDVNVVLNGNVGIGTHLAYPEGPRSALQVQSRENDYGDKTYYNQCHIDPSSTYGSGFCITSNGPPATGGWSRGLNCNLNSDITSTGKLSQFAFHGNPEYIYKTFIGNSYEKYGYAYHHSLRRTSICGGSTGSADAYGNITPASGSYLENGPDGIVTIQQGSDDSNILTFKSSDVDHGYTAAAETDTYALFKKRGSSNGGLDLEVFGESTVSQGFQLHVSAGDMGATQGTGHAGMIDFFVEKIDENGVLQDDITANGNVLAVGGRIGGVARRIFIVDASGDLHCDAGGGADTSHGDSAWTNVKVFDEYNDAQLVRALDMNLPNTQGLIENQWDEYIDYNEQTLIDAGILGDKLEKGGMTNITRLQRLHNGAIWQQYEQFQNLLQAFTKVSNEVIGKEATKELLDSNNIKKLGDA